jgi:DNA modification methylase
MKKQQTQVWRNRIVNSGERAAGEFIANTKNWRIHPKAQREALTGVLSEVGWVTGVLVNKTTGSVIDGHARIEEALKLGDETPVPYIEVELSEEEEAKILATFDPISAMAAADKAQLDALLREVNTGDAALQTMLSELASSNGLDYGGSGGASVEDVEPQIDRAAELQVKWGTARGQLWRLGEHRLLCGDSTNAENVARVMGGEKASIVFTDPPYGVSIGAKNRLLNSVQKAGLNLTDVEDDALSPEELKQRLLPAFINIRKSVMADDCTVFVTAPQGGELSMMMMMMIDAGLPTRHVLIWKKNQPTFSMGRLDYDYQHEPILLTWGKRHKRPMLGTHKTSIWEIDKPRASPEHPTMKPIELYENALLNNSDKGVVAFDAYSGSGTMLMACERQGRKARVIEIGEGYTAVALERWSTATSKQPELIP